MKQNKQMYEAPKVELIEMQAQGVLCSSATEITGRVMDFGSNGNGAWTMP
jgi:hypothetical protein